MGSKELTKVAEETLACVKEQRYTNKEGRSLSLDKLIPPCVRMSQLYKPDHFEKKGKPESKFFESPEITVTRESTLEAAYRLKDENPGVFNFASAKNPGGGFLWGSPAQEETIARASALYPSLVKHAEYYEMNKQSEKDSSAFYLDYTIYSPKVPIFRNDACEFLDEPYCVSVITSPAPKRNKIEQDIDHFKLDMSIEDMEVRLEATLTSRLMHVLNVMVDNEHSTIILGAWGCGAFGNDPEMVTRVFKKCLTAMPYFDNIVFAIYDSADSKVFKTFDEAFSS